VRPHVRLSLHQSPAHHVSDAVCQGELESLTPTGGAIFSDGIEADYLEFNSGAKATISRAAQQAQLVIGPTRA
jgi:hypothetical protein